MSVDSLAAEQHGEGFAFFRWTSMKQAKEPGRCWSPGWGCMACRVDWEKFR